MREIEMFRQQPSKERRGIPNLAHQAETGNLNSWFPMMLIAYCYRTTSKAGRGSHVQESIEAPGAMFA
jgi:hypothetical protein